MAEMVIDWPVCIELAMNKEDVAQELLDVFISTLPEDISDIKALYAAHDFEGLGASIHKLHGACCYTGVPGLKNQLAELEEVLRDDRREIQEEMDQLFETADAILSSYQEQRYRQG